MIGSNYLLAWGLYLLGVVAAQLLLWRLLRKLSSRELQRVLQLCCFAILITPARLAPDSPFWVPAFMAALMEAIDTGTEAAASRLWPMLVLMLVLVVASLLWRFLPWQRKT